MTCNERPASVKRAVQALESNADVDLAGNTVRPTSKHRWMW
jgi:hypothetical protein